MVNASQAVRSLLIPMGAGTLVLPNAAVAEIVAYRAPEPVPGAPEWLLGMLAWREQRIPLLSFEAVAGHPPPAVGPQTHIAVLNAIGGGSDLRFFSMLMEGIPRLVRVDKGVITAVDSGSDTTPAVLCNVIVHGEPAMIPDMDALEEMARQALPLSGFSTAE